MAYVEFRKVKKQYRMGEVTIDALRDITFEIEKGEICVIVGASGAGKTTLLNILGGMDTLTSGKVLLDGEDVFGLPMHRIAEKVGSVFQNPRTQFFNVDTDSEIAFGMENGAVPQAEMKRRVAETAKALHIEPLLGRNIFALSGGEKQKIAFASVYAMEPEIYLLDEPSSNLDMTAIGELREHLKLIKSQGKTVVVAEHRLYYLLDAADRIIYLEDGRIAGDWTPEQFRRIPLERRREMGLRSIDLSEDRPVCSAPTTAATVLELRDVTLAYQKQPVLQGVSLQAAPGDVIAVVGHNGAGKTTFSRALCGLHKETSGSFLWDGKPQKPKERMKRAYMVMQDVGHQLFTDSVAAECALGIKAPNKDEIDRTLEKVDLLAYKERHPLSLSGGQMQRLAVVVSDICGKELLVFDEPTSGLDLKSMEEVGILTRSLATQGKVLLIITHDIEFMMRICTRILFIRDGEIVKDLSGGQKEKIVRLLRGEE